MTAMGRPDGLTEEERTTYTPNEQRNLKAALTEVFGWAARDPERVLSVMTDDSVYHDMTMEAARGMEQLRTFAYEWLAAIPDFDVEVNDTIVDGDTVVFVGTFGGTNKGPMFGQPATNKRLWTAFVQIVKCKDGKVLSVSDYWNKGDMTQQLGIPIDASWEIF